MKESLEELKAIRDGAPDGATFISICNTSYAKFREGVFLQYCHGEWVTTGQHSIYSRTISDISARIELMELLEDIRALGFLEESHDSGVSHRNVCRRVKELL